MKKLGTMWVPSLTDLYDASKKLRSLKKLNAYMECAFDPRKGSFLYEHKIQIDDKVWNKQCLYIPAEIGTSSREECHSADYVRTRILNYVIDNSGG